jgi:flagellar motility protein MotE (MotC chaperone)
MSFAFPRAVRRIRLIPVLIVMGAPLLILKGLGVVHAAEAQVATGSPAALDPTQSVTVSSDPAMDDAPMTSAAEVDVLSSLAKRRAQLDAEAKDISDREVLLSASEKRVDDKIASLKALQDQIQQLLGQRDAEQQAQVATLVKTYSSMKPRDAARIFDVLDDSVLVPVAHAMKPDALAPILAAMQADAAQKLTLKLADRLKLPDPPPAAPATTPVTATPVAAATPVPAGPTPVAPSPVSTPAPAGQQAAATPNPQTPHS